jgi:hypothetical protein
MSKTESLLGTFFSNDGKKMNGSILLNTHNYWDIFDIQGNIIAKDYWIIYLDSERKIPAPKTQKEKNEWSEILVEKIKDVENKIKNLNSNSAYASSSPSYTMELKFLQVRLKEYKFIYTKYFQSNALKFILSDWLSD